jgi:hypothetical protein
VASDPFVLSALSFRPFPANFSINGTSVLRSQGGIERIAAMARETHGPNFPGSEEPRLS